MSETNAAAPKRGMFGAALAGGIIGALIASALLIFALPGVLSSRIVRQQVTPPP